MAETFGTSGSQHGYLVRNANGQVQLAANIASELDSQKPDVVVAITTPMPQAVAKAKRCADWYGARCSANSPVSAAS
ncbi:MAG: hypothetical protein DME22_11735 [Verrucomicrobia bacterium]|nr:MAG: hypothetical protein DME22_11735 [Verrucomicrobiota bacterium]